MDQQFAVQHAGAYQAQIAVPYPQQPQGYPAQQGTMPGVSFAGYPMPQVGEILYHIALCMEWCC